MQGYTAEMHGDRTIIALCIAGDLLVVLLTERTP
jgi:hypothetical protein